MKFLNFLSICMTINLAVGQGREGAPPSLGPPPSTDSLAFGDPSPSASSTVSNIYQNHISILKQKFRFLKIGRYQ